MEPAPQLTKEDILSLAGSILGIVDMCCNLDAVEDYNDLENDIASTIGKAMGLDFEFESKEE